MIARHLVTGLCTLVPLSGKERVATESIGCRDSAGYSRGCLRPPQDLSARIWTSQRDRMQGNHR